MKVLKLCLHLFLVSALPCFAAKTIIVSFDGFRWDYLQRHPTPNMDRVIAEGFRVHKVRPAYPSLTFPNHVTLITGLTPAQHGIAANQMVDRKSGKTFDTSPPQGVDDPYWYQAPMLWELARKDNRKTAVYYWVGSEVRGRHPDRFFNYKSNTPIETRLNRLRRWLDEKRHPSPELMLLYFPNADKAGHMHGPNSKEVAAEIAVLDKVVGDILALPQVKANQVNFLIVSDHGMADLFGKGINIKEIEKSIAPALLEHLVHNWTQTNIFLKKNDATTVKQVMAGLPKRPFLTWYARADFPHPLHPTRTGDIIGIFDKGYQVLVDGGARVYGAHGYPIDDPDMATICLGRGPAFKPGTTIAKTDMVDFFPLVAYLMKLEHGPVAGKLEVWQDILIDPPPKAAPASADPPKETSAHE
ncbi:alkaline phosphatase family protein [Acanthopleuribacter pedis]|uniref:Alkaline phosphatase family protein n=1 Tax=Acanthopleuribacter pedis TaxID=442870 RepID=A0A8J7QIG9_9BACT|nr:ectonucleotide pyrophosphatase/phosphodiesterase [Acanthopleuribacter pedis]MBO1318908.1 alkaline phosphatase family protein [Acanthopleuribacter pedis]